MTPSELEGEVGEAYDMNLIYEGESEIADFLEGIKKGTYNDENTLKLKALINTEVKKELEGLKKKLIVLPTDGLYNLTMAAVKVIDINKRLKELGGDSES